MVDQGLENRLKKLVELCILKTPLSKWSDGALEYWSIGKEPHDFFAFFAASIAPALHYSTTPD